MTELNDHALRTRVPKSLIKAIRKLAKEHHLNESEMTRLLLARGVASMKLK